MKIFSKKKYVQEYSAKELLQKSQITSAEKRGLEQGLEQGQEKKENEIARNMLNANYKVEEISNITKLSKEEINKLKEE